MEEKKTSKLHDIKETAGAAVEIIRQIGTPGVRESLIKVKETAMSVNEIIQSLKTPEMVKNIENLRLISENMNESSTKIQNTMQQIKETGVVDEFKDLIKSANEKLNSFSEEGNLNGQDLRDLSIATKEMFVSLKDLMMEMKVTVASFTNSGTIRNVKGIINEASDIYKMTTSQVN